MTIPDYLDTRDVAARTGIAASTWEKWRMSGASPRFIRAGRRVLYRWQDVETWLAAKTRQSTSDA